MVPVDKASNAICKKYYIEIILRELMNISSSQNTYHIVASDTIPIVDEHLKYFNIFVPPSMVCTWVPKMHKTPYGSRFIAASNRSTTSDQE